MAKIFTPNGDIAILTDTSSSSEGIYLEDGGNIGIGTDSPSSLLHTYVASGNNSLTIESDDSTAQIILDGVKTSDGQTIGQVSFQNAGDSVGALVVRRDGANDAGKLSFFTQPTGGSNTERLTVLSSGNVGIGDDTPSYTLDVAGDVQVQGSVTTCVLGGGSGATNCTSDERLKTNITPIDSALDKIDQLRGVTFNWKDETKTQDTQIGVIAQDVEKVFPQAVGELKDDAHTKTVDYAALVAPLIEATKELKAENEALKDELDALKEQIKQLLEKTE